MLTSTQVYSLTKIWWRLNWAEFLWINANFSFEVPSYFGQTVESWPHMISFFRFLDFFDKDSNDEVEISKFEHLDFKGIKFELYQLIFCCFFYLFCIKPLMLHFAIISQGPFISCYSVFYQVTLMTILLINFNFTEVCWQSRIWSILIGSIFIWLNSKICFPKHHHFSSKVIMVHFKVSSTFR